MTLTCEQQKLFFLLTLVSSTMLLKCMSLIYFIEAGVQTFIEFCDYLTHTCGRKLGFIVKPDMFYNISERY